MRIGWLVMVLPLLLAVSCSDNEEAVPLATPTLSATQPATLARESPLPFAADKTPAPNLQDPDGLAAFRGFAAIVQTAIQTSDVDFFLNRRLEVQTVCRGDEALGQCAGQQAGTVLFGIPGYAWRSDASYIFTPDEYRTNLERYFAASIESASDAYGDGRLLVFALASKQDAEDYEYFAITSSIVDIYPSTAAPIGRQEREAHAFRFEGTGKGDWAFAGEIAAGTLVTAVDWLSGDCAQCFDHWERWEGS
jgi:hypothetical protein